jgi:Phosphotransferase enzyme family
MTPPSRAKVPVAYWNKEIIGGWMYLLPPLAERRVLCISAMAPAQSATQAALYGELVMLHDALLHGVAGEHEWGGAGAAGFRGCSVDSLLADTDSTPSPPGFDGLVIHDPEGTVVNCRNWARLSDLLRRLRKLLRPGAFVYLGVPNPGSPPRMLASLTGRAEASGQGLVRLATLLETLRDAGFPALRIHPYLAWGPKLAEVIPRRGYRATKNRERLAERAKEFLYSRIGARAWAPAYGIVAGVEPIARSTLDLMFEQIAQAPRYRGLSTPVMKNYLLFPGSKAIVTCGPEDRDDRDVVAILTTDALAIERRNVEVAVLAQLALLPPGLAQAIPRSLAQIAIGKTRCYLLSRLPGVTLDLKSSALEDVTDQALQFVIDLHRASAQPTLIDESSYRRLFWSLIESAQSGLPMLKAEFQAWDAPLRACVMGAELPSVWMHGDYKVENVMYEQRLRKLTGVIDWELARSPGLPLLDPLYLLSYNRQIRGEGHIESIESVLWPQRRSRREQERLDRYLKGVKLREKLVPALCAMFVAHHLGCRMHFRADNPALAPLRTLLPRIREMLLRCSTQDASCPVETEVS